MNLPSVEVTAGEPGIDIAGEVSIHGDKIRSATHERKSSGTAFPHDPWPEKIKGLGQNDPVKPFVANRPARVEGERQPFRQFSKAIAEIRKAAACNIWESQSPHPVREVVAPFAFATDDCYLMTL